MPLCSPNLWKYPWSIVKIFHSFQLCHPAFIDNVVCKQLLYLHELCFKLLFLKHDPIYIILYSFFFECLEISISFQGNRIPFQEKIAKKAKEYQLEGILEIKSDSELLVSVCGSVNEIDKFIDFLYEEQQDLSAVIIDIEPFIKEKDYRNVFRIIE